MNKKLAIIGASGHGKVVANIAKLNAYENIVFLDDDVNKKFCGVDEVIGSLQQINNLVDEYEWFVAIGDNAIRAEILSLLKKKGAIIATLIHPSAIIDKTATIAKGSAIMANVVISADAKIGEGCIINTSATIDHECIIHDFVHLSPGVHLAGNVVIGKKTWLGIGAIVINDVNICEKCIIGAASLVLKSIHTEGVYVGQPIRKAN